MASKCRKFVPNMFNKSKCQACFGSKEAHSAEALENNKASRKVSKCGYLFVAPNFDFSNPLDRTRRWQRRFFRLYDDGELTFCVDDHADTVPQGSVDMNKCTDILDAEVITSHSNSIAVVTPEKTEYFKADSKEEIQWWHDVLIEFPNSLKAIKTRRKPNYISNKENVQPAQDDGGSKDQITRGRFEVEKVRQTGSRSDLPAYATFKGVRSLKHKYDKNHQEGMRKSSSLHDLSSEDKDMTASLASSRFLSCSGDRLDVLSSGGGGTNKSPGGFSTNPYFTIPRTSWPCRVHPSTPLLTAPAAHPSLFNSSSSLSSTSSTNSATRRGSFDDRPPAGPRSAASRERGRHSRERSASLKDFPTQLTLPRESGSLESIERRAVSVGSALRTEVDDLSQTLSADETDSNETDELKMARSSEISASSRVHPSPPASSNPEASTTKYEDLVYMKKGWLIKQGPSDRESRKHWFVLAGNSLRYYKDAKAEENNNLDGRIDLSTCYEVSEISTPRNYGFKIKTRNGEYILAAMTSGIRNNWMKAIRLCMDLHSSVPKLGLSTSLTGKALAGLTARTTDDFDTRTGASSSTTSTAMVTGAKGETAFQLVGRREPGKKENRNVRRHHSDVNPGNVSKMFSVKEFSLNLDSADPVSSSSGTSGTADGQKGASSSARSDRDPERVDSSPRASKIPRHHSPSTESLLHSQGGLLPLKRYVEGSDSMVASPVHQGVENRRSKRNIGGEGSVEEEKRELMRRAKSPSARVKEKSRGAKTPRLHSPPPEDEGLEYQRLAGTGDSSQTLSDSEDDMDMTISAEDHYHAAGGHDELDGGHTDSIGDGSMMVEILETEVETLKERLDQTQTQLAKMHESNIDLKSRLQKETSQGLDSGYSSGRWNQPSTSHMDPSQVQTMKRQLKEAKDTVHKQRMEIESLKSKLDMSVSKLTGTEKALSEALKEYKQEKDKFLKLSSEWNRRIRTLEGQMKESSHKLEHSRDNLLTKERECRRLEMEAKQHQQKTREQEREILKLKAVEHEYNQLKERLDNRDRELQHAHAELREKETKVEKVKSEYEHQMGELEREFGRERDDLEIHLEELKSQLHSAQERQCNMEDSMTTSMADIIAEKDDTISQLEEKLIEHDRKMVDMQEELQAEMGENSDLVHSLEILQDEKQNLETKFDSIEKQVLSLKGKVTDLEKDNNTLRLHLDQLKKENVELGERLSRTPVSSDPKTVELQKTIQDLNKQIQDLEFKLRDQAENAAIIKSSESEQDDLLHNILILDSDLKEVNNLLMQLHSRFEVYVSSVPGESKQEASALSEMVDEIGHRCLMLQETLHEGSAGVLPDSSGSDYHHSIDVTPSSSNTEILEEYRHLKGKFDRVVAELKKLKKEVNEVYSSYNELERKDKQLEETVGSMEASYKQQMDSLMQRVDQLSSQLATQHSTTVLQARLEQAPAAVQLADNITPRDIEQKLNQLDSKIEFMEKTLAEAPDNPGHGNPRENPSPRSSSSQQNSQVMSRLQDMHKQLEKAGKDLKNLVKDLPKSEANPSSSTAQQQALVSRLDGCGQKLEKLTSRMHEEGADNPGGGNPGHNPGPKTGCPDMMEGSASSMERCMNEVIERIQEIGEQLDCLEDEAEDSDDEEEEATTVDDVREHVASLCEYVKQHSKFSDYDWHLFQLLSAQKAVVSKDRLQAVASDSADSKDKLKAYADRLSLESLILVEMSHLLEKKEMHQEEEEKDPVMCEISMLNSKVLSLHQKLDREMRTLCVKGASADVLRVQADIMAEKVMVEGQLSAAAFAQNAHLSEDEVKEEQEKKVQHKLLATEAILRSQLDSYIGQNLDKSCDELWSSASHVTTRSLVQGELTFALTNLRKQFSDNPHIMESVSSVRDFSVQRLKDRHKAVMEVAQAYQEKMVQALAFIIIKESEEMTIVEGPENVLDAVCSEISTIMEKHIQRYKEKVRTARDTQTAHRWDMMVNQLRADREVVMTEIRQQHAVLTSDSHSEDSVEVPFQSLDSSINNFGEIVSLRSILCAHLDFIVELLKMGDTTLLAEMEVEEDEEGGEEEEEDDNHRALQRGLCSFVHNLAEALMSEAHSKQAQVTKMLADEGITSAAIPSVPYPANTSQYSDCLMREAVFAAQTTFMMYKLKLLHEQEMDALKMARPVRSKAGQSSEDSGEVEGDVYQALLPLEEVLDTKYDDEMETLRVIASQVGKLDGVLAGRDWPQVEEHVRQLEQKVQDELTLAKQRHEVHIDLFKQEENKVEHMWEESQQERDHLEARCTALEDELRSVSNLHDDEVERMRQDVMTAVSAIRANEEESETQLSDRVQDLTKQMLLQKETYRRFLGKLKGQLSGANKEELEEAVNKQLKDISSTTHLAEDELPPLPSQPPPDAPQTEEKGLNMEEELELLKKEKDEALAEETRNTKAALDAMRKAYEEELQQERLKYRECLMTMYNEDFVSEIRRRHETELEKTQEELKQVKMHYMSKCEDLKLLEVKLGQTKQDYESHINQLIMSNDHLDDMVNQEIERLKDFIKNRPANLTTGTATMEEELYDAQIMIRVKDAELQKLRSQVKNFENSLHRTTEEHRQTMTQYLQALKENQEMRKDFQAEMSTVREQLDKAMHESGQRRPIRRTPSFHQRARSPSPTVATPQRRDSTSAATTEHVSRDSNRRRRIDPKDLRRSKSSPSLPYIFDPKGIATAMKTPGKGDRRQSHKTWW